MPTVIAKGEYPDLYELESGENVAITWDIILANPTTGAFQLRVFLNDEEPAAWTKNIDIAWVMSTHPWLITSGTFYIQDQQVVARNLIPDSEDIHFLLRVYVMSNTEMCETCEEPTLYCRDNHYGCVACQELRSDRNGEFLTLEDEQETFMLCARCQHQGHSMEDYVAFVECSSCNYFFSEDNLEITTASEWDAAYTTITLCEDCRSVWRFCHNCDNLVQEDDMEFILSESYCPACAEEGGSMTGVLYEWNYRPQLVFHPAIPVDPLKPLYIGMELEVSFYGDDAIEWVEYTHEYYGDLLYCKSDSSVENGFEVVTHPMSPAWALENFPFDHFETAIEFGARPKHHSCGTHIHIDKASLTTAQMWKMLQLHMKLQELCGNVGGRGTHNSYAQFDENANEQIMGNMLKIARDKGEAFRNAQRYVAVNVQNEQTIELRYMEGSINPADIRKNIEWVQALYDFTDLVSIQDVKNGALKDESYLLGFVQDGNYPHLLHELKKHYVMPKQLIGRSV